jgi:hypothetical protein
VPLDHICTRPRHCWPWEAPAVPALHLAEPVTRPKPEALRRLDPAGRQQDQPVDLLIVVQVITHSVLCDQAGLNPSSWMQLLWCRGQPTPACWSLPVTWLGCIGWGLGSVSHTGPPRAWDLSMSSNRSGLGMSGLGCVHRSSVQASTCWTEALMLTWVLRPAAVSATSKPEQIESVRCQLRYPVCVGAALRNGNWATGQVRMPPHPPTCVSGPCSLSPPVCESWLSCGSHAAGGPVEGAQCSGFE